MRCIMFCLCMLSLPVFGGASGGEGEQGKAVSLEERQSEKAFHKDVDSAEAKIRELNAKRLVKPREAYEAFDKYRGLLNLFERRLCVSALEYLDAEIKANPVPKLYFQQGLLLSQMKRHAEAYEALTKAIGMEKDPHEKAMYYTNRAGSSQKLGNLEKAVSDFDKALELSPEVSFIYHSRAWLDLQMGDFKKAGTDLESFFKYNRDKNFGVMVEGSSICKIIVTNGVAVKGCPSAEEFRAKAGSANNNLENKGK